MEDDHPARLRRRAKRELTGWQVVTLARKSTGKHCLMSQHHIVHHRRVRLLRVPGAKGVLQHAAKAWIHVRAPQESTVNCGRRSFGNNQV